MSLCDRASTPTALRAVRSWLCVAIKFSRDGVSMFADDGMIDWIWSVLSWIGIAVESKPVRAIQVDWFWYLKIRPRVLW